jgi:heme-degrading monooxygenase HmoA
MSQQQRNDAVPFRVMVTVEVEPGSRSRFEQAWREGASVVSSRPANLAHWLSKSSNDDGVYYVGSDWASEASFYEFEQSEQHLEHRASLQPFRFAGITTMHVLASISPAAAAADPA